jgi:hypothetical protein
LAAAGFGLAAMVVGAERGWVTQDFAQDYVLKVLNAPANTPQCDDAPGGMTPAGSYSTIGCHGPFSTTL